MEQPNSTFSWKKLVPPIIIAALILIGLALLAPHGSGSLFSYRIF